MKTTICLDLDGVIADIAGGINPHVDEGYDYSHWLTGVVDDPMCDKVMANKEFWRNLKPFADSWYQVNYWWNTKQYDVHIVTARYSEHSMSVVERWLDEWSIPYTDFHFIEMGKKFRVIQNLEADLMVEDNPYEYLKLRKYGIPCFLQRAWYNRDFWSEKYVISSLLDISDKVIERIKDGQ